MDLERAAISSLPLAVHRVADLTPLHSRRTLARFGIEGFETEGIGLFEDSSSRTWVWPHPD